MPESRRGAAAHEALLSLGTTLQGIDRLLHALGWIARAGPCGRYQHRAEHHEYQPVEDPRGWAYAPLSQATAA